MAKFKAEGCEIVLGVDGMRRVQVVDGVGESTGLFADARVAVQVSREQNT